MINEEKILASHLGKDNHFKVPEGYFDHLMEQVMDQLPEQEAQIIDFNSSPASWWKHLPLRKIAATVAAVALLGAGGIIALNHLPSHQGNLAQAEKAHLKTTSETNEDATFDEMANYTMMDNETIYASLIAEN